MFGFATRRITMAVFKGVAQEPLRPLYRNAASHYSVRNNNEQNSNYSAEF